MNTAQNIDITYCSRVGKSRLGQNRPISVSLGQKDDKEKLMSIKTKLPQGIYINNEYPVQVKRARDTLCLILCLAKSIPSYCDKSKIEGDHLVINGVKYGIQDIHNLPPELVGYKAAQEEDEEFIAFQGELSLYSNFHRAKFIIDNQTYHSSEQWIQFKKAMLFGDTFTVNQILATSTPSEVKRLGYQINWFDPQRWKTDGYEPCLEGIKEKFLQNPPLLQMLKATHPKTLVEVTLDRQWGTGVCLCDPNVLEKERWHGTGWMSSILSTIRDLGLPPTTKQKAPLLLCNRML